MVKKKKKETGKNRISFYKTFYKKEWFWALIFALLCSVLTLSNLLWASNDALLVTDDLMGHMAKIDYIAGCLKNGEIPSWFGGWYNGTAATQYYVPLSYYVTVPLYWIFGNALLTYKVLCVLVLTIGGMGVWKICHDRIGKYAGFFGIAAYCFQHMITLSLYLLGVIAQAPIIAAMPWYFYAIYNCMEKPTRKNFFGATLTTCVLIFSHAMHAYMVCGATMVIGLVLVLFKKFQWKNYGMSVLTLLLSGILSACWSVVGVLGLEDYNEPYIQQSGVEKFTAKLNWFSGRADKAQMLFSAILIVWALIAVIMMITKLCKHKRILVFIVMTSLLMFSTLAFSFGKNVPGYTLIPMAESLVPGRILTYTAVMAAILFAYLAHYLMQKRKWTAYLLLAVISGVTLYTMNPFAKKWNVREYDEEVWTYVEETESPYEQGRLFRTWSSDMVWKAAEKNLNLSDGWNIEGTVHNWSMWLTSMAIACDKTDYILKQLEYWNVGYVSVLPGEVGLSNALETNGYRSDNGLFYCDTGESNYYLIDPRNMLVIGSTTNAIGVQYPFMVKDNRDELLQYPLEELKSYKCIYLIEQDIRTRSQKEEMEAVIEELVDAGVTVWIEPMASSRFQLFDVRAAQVEREIASGAASYLVEEASPYDIDEGILFQNCPHTNFLSLYNLDEVYLSEIQKSGAVSNAVVGTKKVGNGEVLFLGGSFSQNIEVVYAEYNGKEAVTGNMKLFSDATDRFYQSMFRYYGIETEWRPTPFEASVFKENYRGGTFDYNSSTDEEVTVSITYSPRWNIYLDGQEIPVKQRENLIVLDLPAGEHEVTLEYGMTTYGKIGYLITFAGILLLVGSIVFFPRIFKMTEEVSKEEERRRYIGPFGRSETSDHAAEQESGEQSIEAKKHHPSGNRGEASSNEKESDAAEEQEKEASEITIEEFHF